MHFRRRGGGGDGEEWVDSCVVFKLWLNIYTADRVLYYIFFVGVIRSVEYVTSGKPF